MRYKILVFAVIIIGIFLRFYRLPELTSFSYEQALALEASGKIVQTGKISLIGTEYFIRQTSLSHSFFNSGFYLYPLSLIQFVFGFDPIAPAILFATLNILAGVGLFFLVDKNFKKPTGLITLILFMFSPSMVQISRTVWHVYLLVPIAVMAIWSYFQFLENLKPLWLILLGFSLGLGFGMHISFAIAGIIIFFTLLKRLMKKHKFVYFLYLFLGVLIGYSPLVLFDVRHSFYNLSTMLTFLIETFSSNKSGFSFEPYHFIFLLIPLFIILAKGMLKLFSPKTTVLLLLLYITISFPGWHLSDVYPSGMPKGTNLEIIKQISSLVTKDAPEKFEIASIVDGETRAENLRYLLEYVDKKPPMAFDKYPEANVLYVVSYIGQDPLTKSVWEINSIKPAKVSNVWQISDLIKLSKLEKIND